MESGEMPELDNEQIAELQRRLDAADANPNDVVTWETIEAYVRRQRLPVDEKSGS